MRYSHAAPLSVVVMMLSCTTSDMADPNDPTTATYDVTFTSTWSATTHPASFPTNPHFSGLIGATHTNAVTFWQPGGPASPGIKAMAELGAKGALQSETDAAITAGTADQVVSGGGIGTSPGSVTVSFDMDADFPLLTLVSMLAPSPDWFVGVHGLDMRPGGNWVDSVEVQLMVYDAGTDSGPAYTSANDPTTPAQNIALLTTSPFDQSNEVGSFTIIRR